MTNSPDVLIRHPQKNTEDEWWRRYSFLKGRESAERWMNEEFTEFHVTPETHPKVVELAAGDGPIAKLLVKRGWRPENITCVDRDESPNPMVPGVKWMYIDLPTLYEEYIRKNLNPEPEILAMKGAFDLVSFCNTGWDMPHLEEKLAEYFKRPSGYVFRIY